MYIGKRWLSQLFSQFCKKKNKPGNSLLNIFIALRWIKNSFFVGSIGLIEPLIISRLSSLHFLRIWNFYSWSQKTFYRHQYRINLRKKFCETFYFPKCFKIQKMQWIFKLALKNVSKSKRTCFTAGFFSNQLSNNEKNGSFKKNLWQF